MNRFLIAATLGLMLPAKSVMADALFRPAVTYTQDKTESSGTTTTLTRQMIDLAAGYVGQSGLMLVGLYGTETKNSSSTPGSSTVTDRKSLGAGIGWMNTAGGLYADGIYIFDNQLTQDSNKFTGTGLQIDLGYSFRFSSVALGLQLTYRQFDYKELNGTPLTQTFKQTNIDPMISFAFVF